MLQGQSGCLAELVSFIASTVDWVSWGILIQSFLHGSSWVNKHWADVEEQVCLVGAQ